MPRSGKKCYQKRVNKIDKKGGAISLLTGMDSERRSRQIESQDPAKPTSGTQLVLAGA